MDTTKAVTHVSLCAGYGGIDLGLKRCIPNLRTICFSEIEAFACELLLSRMEAGQLDAAPIWSDLKSFPWETFRGKVGILSGGYPCQPFSVQGSRRGTDDPRHLWPYIADGISRMRPNVVFFENVEGHVSLGLESVLQQLQGLGYKSTFGLFSAIEVGASHQRKRVFILGIDERSGFEWEHQDLAQETLWPAGRGEAQHAWEPSRTLGNPSMQGCQGGGGTDGEKGTGAGPSKPDGSGSGRHLEQGEWQAESEMGGDVDGIANWMGDAQLFQSNDSRYDELRLLGNGVVPQCAARAFATLFSRLKNNLANDLDWLD